MLTEEWPQLEREAELQSLIQYLGAAQQTLHGAVAAHPVLRTTCRALARITKAVSRPMRIAILGESNSGKSSLANLLAGGMTLPALPIANTRLPTLLHYAPAPVATALHAGGKKLVLSAREEVSLDGIVRIEVGLPSEILKRIEILDYPGSGNPLLFAPLQAVTGHGVDAAIWATAATQAWRETERSAWARLPRRIRSRGLLAVTYCDLIATEDDFGRLRGRLETAALPYFEGICFVSAAAGPQGTVAAGPTGAAHLLSQIWSLTQAFVDSRLTKAELITRNLAGRALERLDHGAGAHLGGNAGAPVRSVR